MLKKTHRKCMRANYALIDFFLEAYAMVRDQKRLFILHIVHPNTNINMIHQNYVFQLINAAIAR